MSLAGDFLSALWANGLPDDMAIELRLIASPTRSKWFEAAHLPMLPDPVRQEGTATFSVCAGAVGLPGAMSDADAALAPACWIDIDLIDSTLKKSGAVRDVTMGQIREAAEGVADALRGLPFPPSAIVYSGGGVHAYWRLVEPDRDLDLVEAVNARLATICAGDEAVRNRSRVMRLPGSMNRKYAEPVQAEVLDRFEAWARDYELSDLDDMTADYSRRDVVVAVAEAQEAIVAASGADLGELASAAVVAAPGGMMDGRGDWAEWEAAARAGDNWNSNCLKLVARWVAIGWSDAQIYERGMALRLEGYSEAETRAEFEYFIRSARSKGFAPVVAGRPLDYDTWRDDWALIETSGRFVRLSTRTEVTQQTWRLTNSHLYAVEVNIAGEEKRVPFAKKWLADGEAFKLHDYVMAPDEPLITAGNCLNLWREYRARIIADQGNDPAASRAVARCWQLVLFLCGEREDVALKVLNWIGRGLFHPSERAKFALFIISDLKGAGKSLLGNLVGELYGHEASVSLGGIDGLIGPFPGDVLTGKAFVCVHETSDRGDAGRFGAMERLKSMITEPALSLNRKGVSQISVDNFCRFLFLSNHEDGLVVDDNERRLAVVNCGATEALPPGFYDGFVDECFTAQGLADLARWLRDEHCAELPNRAWRLDMDTVQDSLTSDWAATLNERVADAYMYGVKVAAADMVRVCHDIAGTKLPSQVLKNELKRAGWKNDRGKRDGKVRRFYTNNAKKSDWADDFVAKVGETDALF
jgi:hypothetical protein